MATRATEVNAGVSTEELVKIRLFKDGDKYRDDVFVCVNGKRMQIKRGVDVEIPRSFAEVLLQSMEADAEASEFVRRKEAEYIAESGTN